MKIIGTLIGIMEEKLKKKNGRINVLGLAGKIKAGTD